MNFKAYVKLARLHRPVGIWLLLFPAWWGIGLASAKLPPLFLLFLFACGALLMRGAGCVYNDIIDRDFDIKVRRTASRPLAAGEVTLREAFVLFLFFLGGGALILFNLPSPVILTGFLALALVLLYPWMKRLTYWPQLFLGVTFNIGIIMGWLCLQPTLNPVPFLFYGGAILWTLGYDTIYAFQDQNDDLLIGVKSSALMVSSMPKLFISLVYGFTLILWGIGGIKGHLNWGYWIFWSLIVLQLAWQVFSLKVNIPNNCQKKFESNIAIGLLLFLGIVFSRVID